MRIGIFGGTFNPVHIEHVNLAKAGIEELKLDKLFILPTYISPHKKNVSVSATDRLNMLKLAFSDVEKAIVSDYEIERKGKSYTYLTVEHFKKEFPDSEIFLMMGADMLKDFPTWYNPFIIVKNATLSVFFREGSAVDFSKAKLDVEEKFNTKVQILNYKGKDLSSTEIRLRVIFNLSTDNILNENVRKYLDENNLYVGDKYTDFLKKNLTEKRLVHTINVVATALTKAKELNLDVEKVYLSALLHDVAKYLDEKNYPDFIPPKGMVKAVMHAYLGAHVAKTILGITDTEILSAIKYHTSGRANMSALEKLIFVADMVEKGRDYEGVEILREYFLGDLDKCFIKCLSEEMVHLINRGQTIFYKTIEAYDYYVKGDKNGI